MGHLYFWGYNPAMARANVKTWLPLDEFAQILGIHPLAFNGLTKPAGVVQNNVCGEIFFQYAWQHSDRVGREDIAMALYEAEQAIAREAGFNLMPDWTVEERLSYPAPSRPENYGIGVNPQWKGKSVESRKGHVISGGIKTKTVIFPGATYTRSDVDSDTFQETCTVVVPVTTTDINEIHAYYPGKSGSDLWEIRPIQVSINGGNATIIFKVWQITAANKMDTFNAEPLDADLAASYESTVDIYRVYNDPSTQVQFLWEGGGCGSCTACQLGSQAGCFILRDPRLGLIVPSPGSWNASDGSFDAQNYSMCREPDQVKLWYYSGYRNLEEERPYAELSPYWKYAIAFFAASKLDKGTCGCNNVATFIDKWRLDAAFSSMNTGGFTVPVEIAANKLGTSMGALFAYRQINNNGVRINK